MHRNNDTRLPACPRSSGIGCDELQHHVTKRVGSSVRQLHLKAAHNGLILRGSVRSYYAKQLVQEAVMERTSIPIVSNEIQVTSLPARSENARQD